LGALVTGFKIGFANCAQLQTLALWHGGLQTDISEGVEVGLIAEASHDLGVIAAALDLQGEDKAVLVEGSVCWC
jgi:hypothetical protein